MPKFGAWKTVEEEKQIPMWVIMHLNKTEILKLINNMLTKGHIPNNKTEIMNEAYAKIRAKDFEFFKKSKADDPLAIQLFEKFFSDYNKELPSES